MLLNQGDSPIGADFGVVASKQTLQEARDLINSQQKEVERLTSILLKFLDGITTWGIRNNVDTTEFSLIPILEEQKNNMVRQIETEARREFAEQFKTSAKGMPYEGWLRYTLNIMLKEMEGANNG